MIAGRVKVLLRDDHNKTACIDFLSVTTGRLNAFCTAYRPHVQMAAVRLIRTSYMLCRYQPGLDHLFQCIHHPLQANW